MSIARTGKADALSASDVPWFDLPDAAYRARANALSNQTELVAAAAEFRENGYLIRDFGFSEADLAEAAAYTKAIAKGRVQDAWLVNGAIRRLATDQRVVSFLNQLYQRESFPFQTLNFPRGSQQNTHSDTYHFNSVPQGFMCGVWVALEDIHPDSGPLQYYPGSHRLPSLKNADLPSGADDTYSAQVLEIVEKSGIPRETAKIRRGQAFIWAANLYHGGSPIADAARTRLSQVTHYYFDGCSYFTPLASAADRTFWREPYDIAGKRFVANANPDHRARWKTRLADRLRIWGRRPHSD